MILTYSVLLCTLHRTNFDLALVGSVSSYETCNKVQMGFTSTGLW
jgi:hypothetical protein